MDVTPNDEIVTVTENSLVANQPLQEAIHADLIHENLLVIAIQRGDRISTPRGDTELQPGDRMKISSPDRIPSSALHVFRPGE